MKTTSKFLVLVGLFALTVGCQNDHVTPAFEQQDAPYTAQFAFKTKSQEFAKDAQGRNIIRVVVEGTATYSFAGMGTFTDAFDFVLATGAANHQLTFTAATGDKIYTTMTTQVGQSSITGTTIFTGGTGRFVKIKGGGPNVGPPVAPTGEGSWKEEGEKVTF